MSGTDCPGCPAAEQAQISVKFSSPDRAWCPDELIGACANHAATRMHSGTFVHRVSIRTIDEAAGQSLSKSDVCEVALHFIDSRLFHSQGRSNRVAFFVCCLLLLLSLKFLVGERLKMNAPHSNEHIILTGEEKKYLLHLKHWRAHDRSSCVCKPHSRVVCDSC